MKKRPLTNSKGIKVNDKILSGIAGLRKILSNPESWRGWIGRKFHTSQQINIKKYI